VSLKAPASEALRATTCATVGPGAATLP